MEDGVWHGSGVGLKRLEDEEKAFVVGGSEGGKRGYFLERLIVFDVGELESADKGSQSFSAKP